MTPTVAILDLGLRPYAEVWDIQRELFTKALNHKQAGQPVSNTLILCEHPPVFTLGKSGKPENLLVKPEQAGVEFFQTDRGGDVTFHGPGQLVAYPILDLETLGIGLADYIFKLEQTIIDSLLPYGLHPERIEGAAGVWLRNAGQADKKICAIGVRASRHITMHGLAININTDLTYFDMIVPCGLNDKGVTSLAESLGHVQDMNTYRRGFIKTFDRVYGVTTVEGSY